MSPATRAAPRPGRATARARVALLVGDPDRRGDRRHGPLRAARRVRRRYGILGGVAARAGGDVIACDSRRPGGSAERISPARPGDVDRGPAQPRRVAAARQYAERSLVLCWPPYDDDEASYAVLRAYRGDIVIHIGEPDEGATGSVRFHRELRLNWTLVEAAGPPALAAASRPRDGLPTQPEAADRTWSATAASSASASSRPARSDAATLASSVARRRSRSASAGTASNIRRTWSTRCRLRCARRSRRVRAESGEACPAAGSQVAASQPQKRTRPGARAA